MTVLAFCSSATVCSVAVVEASRTLACETFAHEMRLLERLMPVTQLVLERAGVRLETVDRIAADLGPGSFTGIRIGVMTAKTIAWALNKDIVGVSALECLAYQARHTPVVALIRARPGMVYRQAFGAGLRPLDQPQIVSAASPRDILGRLQSAHETFVVADPEMDMSPIENACSGHARLQLLRARINAEAVGRLALNSSAHSPSSALHVTPLYLAEPLIGPPKSSGPQDGNFASSR